LPGEGRGDPEGTAVPACELLESPLPRTILNRADSGGTEVTAQQRRGGELEDGAGDVIGVWPAEHPGVAVLDQRGRATLGDRDDRQAAGAGLEHDLAIGVGGRAEKEDVGAGIGARQILALEPAEERRPLAEPCPQLRFLRPTAGKQQVQPRIRPMRQQEALGEQVDPLLAGEAAGVEDLDLAGIVLADGLAGAEAETSTPRSQRPKRAGSTPSASSERSAAGLGESTREGAP
jgi:hypothetical protein